MSYARERQREVGRVSSRCEKVKGSKCFIHELSILNGVSSQKRSSSRPPFLYSMKSICMYAVKVHIGIWVTGSFSIGMHVHNDLCMPDENKLYVLAHK